MRGIDDRVSAGCASQASGNHPPPPTPTLHFAARYGRKAAVPGLPREGVSTEARAVGGRAVLDEAACHGYWDIVVILIRARA